MSPFLPPKVSVPVPTPTAQTQKRPNPKSRSHSSVGTHRTQSISSWVKHILPRHRPERRGTLRRQGFWEQQELEQPDQREPQGSIPDQRRPRSATVGSNHLTEWNMARDLSEWAGIPHDPEGGTAADADRKWSWDSADDAANGQGRGPDKSLNQRARVVHRNGVSVAEVSSFGQPSLSTTDFQFLEERKESQRLRRNLKESGDYLGVQGFNPETGQLDVVTSTDSDMSTVSQETQRKLFILQKTLKDARHSYKSAREKRDKEATKILLKKKEKLDRLEKGKDEIKDINKTVKWKRHTRQWSSAQEPDLSPIAQSIADTGEASCRGSLNYKQRPSKDDLIPGLIDLEADSKPRLSTSILYNEGQLGQSSDSTVTVVRTPHRQSVGDPSESAPSAWELFVNGISFDSSDKAMPVNPKLADRETTDTKFAEENTLLASGSSAHDGRSIRPLEIFKVSRKASESNEQDDGRHFLDLSGKRQEDPRGSPTMKFMVNAVTNRSRANISLQEAHFCHRTRSTDLSGLRKQNRPEPVMLKHNQTGDENPHGMTMTTSHVRGSFQSEDTPSPAGSVVRPKGSRKKSMQNWGHWISRRTGLRRYRSSEEVTEHTQPLPVSAVQYMTDLGKVPQIPNNWGTDLTSGLGQIGQEIPPSRLAMNMRMVADETDRHVAGEDKGKAQVPMLEKNQDKIKNTLPIEYGETVAGNINMQNQPMPAGYACTRITTTTGCGQQGLQASFLSNDKRETQNPGPLISKRRPHGMVSDPPPVTKSEFNLGSSVTKHSQNPWLNLDHTNHGIAVDTIWRHRQMLMSQRIKRSIKPPRAAISADTMVVAERRPTHLLTRSTDDTGLKGRADGIEKRSQVACNTSSTCANTTIAVQTKPTVREEVEPDLARDDFNELITLNQGPGSFPGPNLGEDMDNGCESSYTGSTTITDSPYDPTKNYLKMVRCHLRAFLLLYWDIVGPVFHFRSEYWERNKRNESTLADGFALVVALPGAIVAVMGLV